MKIYTVNAGTDWIFLPMANPDLDLCCCDCTCDYWIHSAGSDYRIIWLWHTYTDGRIFSVCYSPALGGAEEIIKNYCFQSFTLVKVDEQNCVLEHLVDHLQVRNSDLLTQT